MIRFSPKIELINYFDDLIKRVDIEIEQTLEKYGEDQALGDLKGFEIENRKVGRESKYKYDFFDSYKPPQANNQWSESTKVVDYLNQVRMRTIEELRNAQEESLENPSRFSHLKVEIKGEKHKDELKSQLFALSHKFYFQIQLPNIKSTIFNLYTIVTDFYMSQSDINLLEKFLKASPFPQNSMHAIDEKMFLIGLIHKYFCHNIKTQKFPNNLIQVFKQDILNVKRIDFLCENIIGINLTNSSIDLSKLEELSVFNYNYERNSEIDNSKSHEIKIEGLSSLQVLCLELELVDQISLKYLNSLRKLDFKINYSIDHSININITKYIFDLIKPEIEKFFFENFFGVFFNSLEKSVLLKNVKHKDLNFEYAKTVCKTICNQIEKLRIWSSNSENISKLLSSHHFPNLLELEIKFSEITRIEKKLFGELPMLQKLIISSNDNLKIIDEDAFSNFKQLVHLDLSSNRIESLEKMTFFELVNLNYLDLRLNRLKSLDENMFSGLKNLKTLKMDNS